MYFSKVMLNPDIIKEENPNKWNMIQWAIKTVHSIYTFFVLILNISFTVIKWAMKEIIPSFSLLAL